MMAATGGAPRCNVDKFQVVYKSILQNLDYNLVSITTHHTRPHWFGGDATKSVVFPKFDPHKVIAATVRFHRYTRYLLDYNGKEAIEFESHFNDYTGKLYDTPNSARGHYLYVKIREERDPSIASSLPYAVVTLFVNTNSHLSYLNNGQDTRADPSQNIDVENVKQQ